MADPIRIIGTYISPYVRKVLVFLSLKGVPYQIDPIIPFMGDDRFSALSPLRRIPVLVDDWVTLTDSSVICEYLEERYPQPALYPRDIVQRARARWLEEFADTRMAEVFIWRLFNQVAIKPFVWGEPTDTEEVAATLAHDVPQILDYLEAQVPPTGFVCGELSIADIALACFFRNAGFAGFTIDAARWPITAALVARVWQIAAFRELAPFEDRLVRTPIPRHREVLTVMGAPLTPDTYGTPTPRRGVMQV